MHQQFTMFFYHLHDDGIHVQQWLKYNQTIWSCYRVIFPLCVLIFHTKIETCIWSFFFFFWFWEVYVWLCFYAKYKLYTESGHKITTDYEQNIKTEFIRAHARHRIHFNSIVLNYSLFIPVHKRIGAILIEWLKHRQKPTPNVYIYTHTHTAQTHHLQWVI